MIPPDPVAFEKPATFPDTTSGPVVRLPDPQELDSILPILSRLPRNEDEEDENPNDHASTTDYLTPKHGTTLPGTLTDSRQRVLYTVSRLPAISDTATHLWRALHLLKPLTVDYAGTFASHAVPTPPSPHHEPPSSSGCCPFLSQTPSTVVDLIRTVFNWPALTLPLTTQAIFYGVAFRSLLRAGADASSANSDLYAADRLAHEEAVAAGGLLAYWYGAPDARTGANLATCVWASRADAVRAARLPMHARAVRRAGDAYRAFELGRYAVVKRGGEVGVRIEEWSDGLVVLEGLMVEG